MWNSVASFMIQRSTTQTDGKDVHLGGSRAAGEGGVNLIHCLSFTWTEIQKYTITQMHSCTLEEIGVTIWSIELLPISMNGFATCVKTKHTWILCVTKWSKRLTNQHIVGLAKNGPLEKFGLPLLWCRWFNIGTHCSHFVTPCSPLFHRCFTLLSASTHCSCLCCTMQALVMERNRLKTKA